MSTITKRQKEIYDYVENYIGKKGYSPTFEEIRKHFRLKALSGAHQHIDALVKKGMLIKNEHSARGIELCGREEMAQVPMLGTIAAGRPIEGVRERESIAVPRTRLPGVGNFFALRVDGESMADEDINDGDMVIIKEQPSADDGQKVVALIDNSEVTLKKIYKEKGKVRLQPANPKIDPIYVEPERLMIQGVVIDVIKNLDNKGEIEEPVKSFENKKTKPIKAQEIKKHLNTVFLGDIMKLLKKLPDKSVDMVFSDPDYNVGIKYGAEIYTKNFKEYIDWYIELSRESMRVLKNHGSLFTMNYPKQNAHLRVKYLDDEYPLVTENVWVYNSNVGHSPKRFTTAHRSILHVRKSKNNKFYKENVALPYKNPTDKRILENLKNGSKGRMPYSWYYFDLVKNVSKEKTYHACQIPQKLTEMLIKSCTRPNDIVLTLFGGSGAEIEVCKRLKRQYISAEIDPKYHEIIMDRLKNGYIKPQYKLQTKRRGKQSVSLLPLFSKAV